MNGLTDVEVELFMKAMLFSGERLSWPVDWNKSLVSTQSTGTTGNKAKVILAPTLAACGVKVGVLLPLLPLQLIPMLVTFHVSAV